MKTSSNFCLIPTGGRTPKMAINQQLCPPPLARVACLLAITASILVFSAHAATSSNASATSTLPNFKVSIQTNWTTDKWAETLELVASHSLDAFAAVLPLVARAIDPDDIIALAVQHGLPQESADLVKLGVALREGAPRVQALNAATKLSHIPNAPVDCSTFFVATDEILTCDLDDLSRQLSQPNRGRNTPLVRDLDKYLIGPFQSLQAIMVFAHPRHPEFPTIWEAVASLRTRVAIRYLPLSPLQDDSPIQAGITRLHGFHAHLQIKNTEYKVVDDRKQAKLYVPAPGPPLAKIDEAQLDQLAVKVIQNVTSLGGLVRLSQDYPLTLPELAANAEFDKARADQLHVLEQALSRVAGEAPIVVSVNGQIIPWKRSSTFNLLAFLRHEHRLLSKAREHLLDWEQVVAFVKHSINHGDHELDRFDYCTLLASPPSQSEDTRTPAQRPPALIWLNDLEQDERYAAWPRQLYQLMMAQGLPRVARNILNAVLFMDLSNPTHRQVISELDQFIQQGFPIRFGIVPWVSDDRNGDASIHGVRFVQTAIQRGSESALHQLTSSKKSTTESSDMPGTDDVSLHARLLSARMHFDVKQSGALFLNGRYLDFSPEAYRDVLGEALQHELNSIRQAMFFGSSDYTDETDMGQRPCVGAWKSRPAFVFNSKFVDEFAEPLFIAEPAQAIGELGVEGGIMPYVHLGLRGRLTDSQVNAVVRASKRLGFSLDPVSEKPIPGPPSLIVNGRVFRGVPRALSASAVEMLVRREVKLRLGPLYKSARQKAESQRHKENRLTHQVFWRLSSLWWWNKVQVERLLPNVNSQRMDVEEVVPCSPTTCLMVPARGGKDPLFEFLVILHPISEHAQFIAPLLAMLHESLSHTAITLAWRTTKVDKVPNRFTRFVGPSEEYAVFQSMPSVLYTLALETVASWVVSAKTSELDLDNLVITTSQEVNSATFDLDALLVEGYAKELQYGVPPRGMQLVLSPDQGGRSSATTVVMANLGNFQLKASPGVWHLGLRKGTRTADVYSPIDQQIIVDSLLGTIVSLDAKKRPRMEHESVIEQPEAKALSSPGGQVTFLFNKLSSMVFGRTVERVHVFSVASGHLYERFLSIMMQSVTANTKKPVTFWLLGDFLSPSFKAFLPELAKEFKFDYHLLSYSWPEWLREQADKQRKIWAYKILFLDVLFPLENGPDRIIFVDADQVVRADLSELMAMDLNGAVWAYTPFCDNREDIEGFRFWKQGYWLNHLRGKPYHISALYVVDLDLFRRRAAGDILREQYQMLSADPNSLANLDQDLPNHLQHLLEIHSLPQDWLWCETWCSDDSLKTAKTIDLCNNPMTREPKLDRARRLLPEWQTYDERAETLRSAWLQRRLANSSQDPQRLHDEL